LRIDVNERHALATLIIEQSDRLVDFLVLSLNEFWNNSTVSCDNSGISKNTVLYRVIDYLRCHFLLFFSGAKKLEIPPKLRNEIESSDGSSETPDPVSLVKLSEQQVDRSVKSSSDKSAKSSSNKPVKSPSDKPAKSSSDRPVKSPSDKPAESSSDKPVKSPSDKPAESSSDKPAESPSDKPAESSTDIPFKSPSFIFAEPPINNPDDSLELENADEIAKFIQETEPGDSFRPFSC